MMPVYLVYSVYSIYLVYSVYWIYSVYWAYRIYSASLPRMYFSLFVILCSLFTLIFSW